MLNYVVLMGRFVRDPEMSVTPSGIALARFTLACDRDFKNKETGARDTDFIDFVAWRRNAEFVRDYFTKGRMAVVEGRIQTNRWEDKESGDKRQRTEIVVSSIYFGDSKKSDTASPAAREPASSPPEVEGDPLMDDAAVPEGLADNLPF